jgi:transposase
MVEKDEKLSKKYKTILPYLTEKQKRFYLASEANYFGYGGIKKVSLSSGVSNVTICNAIKELEQEKATEKATILRSRKPGAGRKRVTEKHPDLWDKLSMLLDPHVRGDPESPLLWTSKSMRKLSAELQEQNHLSVNHRSIGEVLKSNNFSLQANRKTYEGKTHPDRDQQFNYINKMVKLFQKESQPVISIDAKKKELVGNFKNSGQEWREKGSPIEVNAYDFLTEAKGKAIPYGIYDMSSNKGWVNVGVTKDTAEFAVESIRNWWYKMGIYYYPNASELLITADSGGSNGIRVKLWKRELQILASEIGMSITLCHFPPGTSKWNKIEHRLFSYISKNWRGKPLETYQIIVNLIGATKTTKGLEVVCELDSKEYKTGIKVSDKEMEQINIVRKEFHGEWNYSILPE